MECPVCLDEKEPAPGMFQCSHQICDECSTNMISYHLGSCPVCRADPKAEYQFSVQIVSNERQLFCTDHGSCRIIDEDGIRVTQFTSIMDLLPELHANIVFGVRYIEGTVGYIVHGPPSEWLLDMLSRVPRSSATDRAGRHARIELGRVPDLYAELINGVSLAGIDFVRYLQFPVQLVEMQIESDVESEEDP